MDGLALATPDGGRTLRRYPLSHIARWALRGPSLVLYTKAPGDASERVLTLAGDDAGVRSLLDTLTCCCMQMVELLQADADDAAAAREAAGRAGAPSAASVAYWRSPDKAGWLQSQGDHIKTWRRRWHVLKDGFLFRFGSAEEASKPGARARGTLALASVVEVGDGRDATGRANAIRLGIANGPPVCYVADSETDAVEWVSALDAGVDRAVRAAAGLSPDDGGRRRSDAPPSDWAARLAAGYGAAGGRGGPAQGRALAGGPHPPPPSSHAPDVITVVGYGGDAPTAPTVPGGAYGGVAGARTVGGFLGAPAPGHAGFQSAGAYPSFAADAPISVTYGGGGGEGGGYGGGCAPAPAPAPPPPPPQTAPAPALPHPWQLAYTPDGQAYFFNAATRETQWHPPATASLV